MESSIEKSTLPDFESLFTFFVEDCLLKYSFLFNSFQNPYNLFLCKFRHFKSFFGYWNENLVKVSCEKHLDSVFF